MNSDKTPTQQVRAELNQLSKDFKPTDIKFLIAPNSEVSMAECMDDASKSIQALHAYVMSGHSDATATEQGFISVSRTSKKKF